ncbi:hypothetical protein ANCCEY_04487 [Ancylostoma ceylanicum]|uniref:Secreted protein n=1 Tax=Ancylostoma ceylanicum TaxID=53326 RepID=A0A0D6LX88_9BILA|nr:hypothetical protein ANCCEY_04487 [Ancylostoma ceylanicum]
MALVLFQCIAVSLPGMTSLSTSYTAAIAANTNPARHERYAAHIPVNKGDSSGRQSTVSQDSQHRLVNLQFDTPLLFLVF